MRKTSAEICAELDELTKNEVKDNRRILSDKESYDLLNYAILDQVKKDIGQDPTKFKNVKTKPKNIGFNNIVELNDQMINNIADSDERSYWDAVSFIDDGRMELLLKFIDPYMEMGKIKDEFHKRIK